MTILSQIHTHLFSLLLLSMGAGFVISLFTGGIPFSPWICVVAAIVMVYPSLVPLSLGEGMSFFKESHGRGLLLLSLVLNAGVAPLVAYAVGAIFFSSEPAFRFGLLLLGLFPGGGMVTTWALRSKANMGATVSIVMSAMLVSVFASPFILSYVVDTWTSDTSFISETLFCPVAESTGGMLSCGGGDISVASFAPALVVVFGLPLLLSLVTRYFFLHTYEEKRARMMIARFGPLGSAGLLLVLFLLTLSLGSMFAGMKMGDVLVVLPALIFFYALYGGIVWLIARRIVDFPRRVAFVWGTSLRYLTLALGFAVSIAISYPALAGAIVVIMLSYVVQIPGSSLIEYTLRRYAVKGHETSVKEEGGI